MANSKQNIQQRKNVRLCLIEGGDEMALPVGDAEALRVWLLAQEGTVGEARESRVCPLAHYLLSITGQVYWVNDEMFGVADCWQLFGVHDHTRCVGVLPTWAAAFVRGIDAVCMGAVSSMEALGVLDSVLQGLS
jgi:hypothetical protein